MHRDPETAEPGNGISIYAFLYYIENYGPRRAIPRTRPALTRNVRDNLPRLDYCAATLSFLSLPTSSSSSSLSSSCVYGTRHSLFRRENVTSRDVGVSHRMIDNEAYDLRFLSDFGQLKWQKNRRGERRTRYSSEKL